MNAAQGDKLRNCNGLADVSVFIYSSFYSSMKWMWRRVEQKLRLVWQIATSEPTTQGVGPGALLYLIKNCHYQSHRIKSEPRRTSKPRAIIARIKYVISML